MGHYCWQCRQNLSRAFTVFLAFTTILYTAYSPITVAVTVYSAHTPVLPSFPVTIDMPLLVRSWPVPTLTTIAAVLLQTICFAVNIVSSRRPLRYPVLVTTPPLVVVLLATVSLPPRSMSFLPPLCGGANSAR